jgi:soluble lytic murein transglycosylase-like protein
MQYRRASYVHRGDAIRRRNRLKRLLLAASFVAVLGLVIRYRGGGAPADAQAASTVSTSFFQSDEARLEAELEAARGELALTRVRLDRATKVIEYATRYRIAPDLAQSIIDVASAEGIDPELGFRLVKLESDFKERAISPVGAVGLTQLMPATARFFQKGVSREKLFERETNLRIGFRYLRGLMKEYDGDVSLALLVYNRGPVAVQQALRDGQSPTNGYDRIITRGYAGTGIVH